MIPDGFRGQLLLVAPVVSKNSTTANAASIKASSVWEGPHAVSEGSRSGARRKYKSRLSAGDSWWTQKHDGERTKQTSRIRSTKRGFVKKNVRGFRYKPRGDWFSFAKVRKLCFRCSYKQTLFFARLTHACAAPASYGIHRKGSLSWTRVRQIAEVTQNCLYRFKFVFVFYKNASIRYRRPLFTPRSLVMHVLIRMCALYLTTFALLNTTTRPCHYRAWKSQDIF